MALMNKQGESQKNTIFFYTMLRKNMLKVSILLKAEKRNVFLSRSPKPKDRTVIQSHVRFFGFFFI
ncbi:hypothetical protein BN000_04984 [Neobacillus massiliamazoniensis]|uniref:Uncharacterized protein n=1 Tax=Neobacillus massiliamazoniensis TaxID=1499688 RepID=A0A0U1P3R5_9BACI|nr:hypothetical protein BN000_04984 [Neobacillus massiliamazoniensis]